MIILTKSVVIPYVTKMELFYYTLLLLDDEKARWLVQCIVFNDTLLFFLRPRLFYSSMESGQQNMRPRNNFTSEEI